MQPNALQTSSSALKVHHDFINPARVNALPPTKPFAHPSSYTQQSQMHHDRTHIPTAVCQGPIETHKINSIEVKKNTQTIITNIDADHSVYIYIRIQKNKNTNTPIKCLRATFRLPRSDFAVQSLSPQPLLIPK